MKTGRWPAIPSPPQTLKNQLQRLYLAIGTQNQATRGEEPSVDSSRTIATPYRGLLHTKIQVPWVASLD